MAEETQTTRRVTSEEVMEKLQPIEDPEILISIVDLGLIYDVACRRGQHGRLLRSH